MGDILKILVLGTPSAGTSTLMAAIEHLVRDGKVMVTYDTEAGGLKGHTADRVVSDDWTSSDITSDEILQRLKVVEKLRLKQEVPVYDRDSLSMLAPAPVPKNTPLVVNHGVRDYVPHYAKKSKRGKFKRSSR